MVPNFSHQFSKIIYFSSLHIYKNTQLFDIKFDLFVFILFLLQNKINIIFVFLLLFEQHYSVLTYSLFRNIQHHKWLQLILLLLLNIFLIIPDILGHPNLVHLFRLQYNYLLLQLLLFGQQSRLYIFDLFVKYVYQHLVVLFIVSAIIDCLVIFLLNLNNLVINEPFELIQLIKCQYNIISPILFTIMNPLNLITDLLNIMSPSLNHTFL